MHALEIGAGHGQRPATRTGGEGEPAVVQFAAVGQVHTLRQEIDARGPCAQAQVDPLLGIEVRAAHRELVSGLDLAVGFKNGTDGSLGIACDAMRAAAHGHRHFGLDDLGHPALLATRGNPDTHLVLRGGHGGPNHQPEAVAAARQALAQQGIAARIMVDCSHANSGKDPLRQPAVLEDVVNQRLAGQDALRGVMIESHLFDGAQSLSRDLRYGVSITDGCLGWEGTERILREAAERLRG